MKIKPLTRWAVILGTPLVGLALLFPIFGRARDNARSSSCQNNLKQMGVAFAQYANDYSSFPLAVVGGTQIKTRESKVPAGWADALEIYTKSR